MIWIFGSEKTVGIESNKSLNLRDFEKQETYNQIKNKVLKFEDN